MKVGVIDIGNSLIKCAIIENENVISYKSFEFDEIEKLKNFFKEVNEICYCNVVKNINLNNILFEKKLYELNYETSLIKLNYSKTLGSDRIAKAHYIAFKIKETSIILDFGTATVIDIVNNEFIGGLILLGYKSYLKCLHQSASKLPDLSNQDIEFEEKLIGNTTEEAIILALINAYKFLALKIEENFNIKHKFITGGNAKIFLKYFKDYKYEPYLSLLGLYFWFINFKAQR
ncbi:MAG: type III pantothenate kinase [candidate division WOR-3 bacterium]|jgi:type III pantothenate kinase